MKGSKRHHRRGRTRISFVLAIGLLLTSTGCISEEREQEIGDTMAQDVNPHLPLIEEPLLDAYLHAIGTSLGAVSERPDLEYHFYIVDTDVVNAFALPGGHVYLTRGLIERTSNGAEFAGVIAHEIGHIAARHGVRKLERHLRTGSLVNVLYNTILGGEPDLLRDNSLQLANLMWSARHSRRDEEEADRMAVKYLIRTGTEPLAVVTLLESLLEEEQPGSEELSRFGTWFSTHPLTQSRIEEVRRDIDMMKGDEKQVAKLDLTAFPAFKLLVTHTSFPE